jgi:hypothetical protein
MRRSAVSRWHGVFTIGSGAWPLLHMRSFEAVFGPKVDRWLVRTVAGLLVTNGLAIASAGRDPAALRVAARVAVGTAATLAGIDLVYVPRGRISKTYLVDAAAELGWIALWAAARPDTSEPILPGAGAPDAASPRRGPGTTSAPHHLAQASD